MKAINWAPFNVSKPISEWVKTVLHKGTGQLISIDVCLNTHTHRQMKAKLKCKGCTDVWKQSPYNTDKSSMHRVSLCHLWSDATITILHKLINTTPKNLPSSPWIKPRSEQCHFLETPVLSDCFSTAGCFVQVHKQSKNVFFFWSQSETNRLFSFIHSFHFIAQSVNFLCFQ